MRIGVVGLGYWGPNIVRNLASMDSIEEVVCTDIDEDRIRHVVARTPKTRPARTFEELLGCGVHAVAVITPMSTHHALVRKALMAGKHVMVEKPLALNVRDCEDLVNLADEHGLTLMVDHTFVYTGAVRKMKEIMERGEVGDVYYYDSVRVNLGLLQHDANVLWDLAPHDLSIMEHLVGRRPTGVMAVGAHHYNEHEDVAYLTVFFDDQLIAHIHVNWLAPVKVRRILIGGSRRMIVYDDMESNEKVKIYDSGVKMVSREGLYKTLVEYRTGDMFAPKLDQSEALQYVVKDFIAAISTGSAPVSDGRFGTEVVRVLEAAQHSIKNNGILVSLDPTQPTRSVHERISEDRARRKARA